MRALVYEGNSRAALTEKPKPTIQDSADAIIKVFRTTICGTELHIKKGDSPTCVPGTLLGHEGVGIMHEVGDGVKSFKKDDRVLISCI